MKKIENNQNDRFSPNENRSTPDALARVDARHTRTMSYGRSLALSQNSFVQPPEDDDSVDESYEPGVSRRQATVYDAVAGRFACLSCAAFVLLFS